MLPLEKTLRNQLERTIKDARDVAEAAAQAAVEQLGVGEPKPYAHLSADEKELRRKLRIHGRQLGDFRHATKQTQEIDRLVEEVAYEHWHRMLFARFLAENNLLMYPDLSAGGDAQAGPDDPVAVSLEECEDLAAEEGAKNGWELASRFAARMLPQIFRPDLPAPRPKPGEFCIYVLQCSDGSLYIGQSNDFRRRLDEHKQGQVSWTASRLPVKPIHWEIFDTREQAVKREQDLKTGFGRKWLKRELAKGTLAATARQAGSPVFQLELPPEHQQKLERLLAELPKEVFHASDSLGWVYQFWQAKKKDEVNRSEVKIGARELPAVTQLFTEPYMVAFLLDNSLGAWWAARRLTEADLTKAETEDELRQKASLPGVPLDYLRFVKGEDGRWTPAAGAFDGWPEKLAELKTLDPCCGSGHFLVAAFLMLVPMRMELEGLSASEAVDAVLRENIHGLEIDQRCVELAAFALALAAWRYPGAGGYRQLPELNVACSGLSISAKKEDWLALAGGDRSLSFHLEQLYDLFKDAPILGSLIDPILLFKENTLFAQDWKSVQPVLAKALAREKSEERVEMAVVAQGLCKAVSLLGKTYSLTFTNPPYLGSGKQAPSLKEHIERAYPSASSDIATCFMLRLREIICLESTYAVVSPQNWTFATNYMGFRTTLLKNDSFCLYAKLGEKGFESSAAAGAFTVLTIITKQPPEEHSFFGIDVSELSSPNDKADALRCDLFLRVSQSGQLRNPDSRILLSESEDIEYLSRLAQSLQGVKTGDDGSSKRCYWELGVVNSTWKFFRSTVDHTMAFGGMEYVLLWGGNGRHLARLQGMGGWGKRGVAVSLMRKLRVSIHLGEVFDSNIGVVVPENDEFILPVWAFCEDDEFDRSVREIDPRVNAMTGSLVKVPFDLDHWTKVAEEKYPNGLPKPYSDDPTQWIFHGHPCGSVIWDKERKWTAHGPLRTDSTVLHVAVARLLGYRWPAELDSEMELSDEARALVAKCDDLLKYADKDGIVCIPPVRGEASAADRLLNLLAAAYGDDWSTDKLSELLKQADHTGKTLDSWLRDKFFAQHCQLFHQRPFIWHIWDGLRDGFSVLVNYHKLALSACDHAQAGRKNLETLIYTYLGDWIKRQKDDISSGVDGAQERLAAAKTLKKRLELILEGEAPYDIFVRWKPIEKQPIGWDPDSGDGVRLNIRPFMSVPDVKKKGAGVLREKPKIHWKKDRGKDVKSAPWYHLFKGDRINDHHLSLDEKRAALEKAVKEAQ